VSAAAERAIALKPSELAKLQERAGGNPMLASRAVDEEYLGLDGCLSQEVTLLTRLQNRA
jgi:hypothetical protein